MIIFDLEKNMNQKLCLEPLLIVEEDETLASRSIIRSGVSIRHSQSKLLSDLKYVFFEKA
jgi:hypothetical protein